MLAKSGVGARRSLLQVLNIIKTTHNVPEEWRHVLITMIYKNKGSHLDLEKYRGIFLTVVVSKLFERLLQARMKPSLDNVSLNQAGSRTGKGPSDDLFLLRGAIDHSIYMNNSVYISTYDFRQAFDSLWLQDCIMVLKRLGVEDYLLKLIYEMNKTAIVQVKTPYGLTNPTEVTDIVKQGGVLGSPMCSATTAEYCDINIGIPIGTATVATLAFVDDIADISGCSKDAITAHLNALEFALKKKLNFAPDKCFIMIVNKKSGDEIPELYINGEKMDNVDLTKYLGDIFNSKGNNEDLMNDRVKRGKAAMISIQGFMREICLGVHTLSVYRLLHNSIFLQGILFNSQAWSNLTERDIKKIAVVQRKFLRRMMGVKQAAANSFLHLELGVLPIEYEVHKRQLSFLHHIVNLEEKDPVKLVWRNQKALPEYPNWWKDVRELMRRYEINITENGIVNMTKCTFKKKIKDAVLKKAFKDLCTEVSQKSKTQTIRYTRFAAQDYISKLYPNQAKIVFQCRSKTLNIKEQSEHQFKNNFCRWCGIADETLSHIVNCGSTGEKLEDVEQSVLSCNDTLKLSLIANRIEDFLSRVQT